MDMSFNLVDIPPDLWDDMTDEEYELWEDVINAMSREHMCREYRFAKPGSRPYFKRGNPLVEYFKTKFKLLGGFSPEISKRIGF